MKHCILVEYWHPVKLNELLGSHWAVAAKRKRIDRLAVGLAFCNSGVEIAGCKRRVSLLLTLVPRQRAGDPDCYWKSTLDALVACGALKDDSRQWCELGTVEFRRGAARETLISLEDLA